MSSRLTYFGVKWLPGALFAGTILFWPVAGSCIFYGVSLPVSMTVNRTLGSGLLSVARSTGGDVAGSLNAVTINSQGSTPYMLFIDQGLNATGSQRNLRGDAGVAAYKLCQDAACATVWATNGDPTAALLVTPGSVTTALPLTVVRTTNAVADGSYRDVVTLTMYF